MSRYGHLSVTDSFQSPDKILIYFLKKKKKKEKTSARVIRTLNLGLRE